MLFCIRLSIEHIQDVWLTDSPDIFRFFPTISTRTTQIYLRMQPKTFFHLSPYLDSVVFVCKNFAKVCPACFSSGVSVSFASLQLNKPSKSKRHKTEVWNIQKNTLEEHRRRFILRGATLSLGLWVISASVNDFASPQNAHMTAGDRQTHTYTSTVCVYERMRRTGEEKVRKRSSWHVAILHGPLISSSA